MFGFVFFPSDHRSAAEHATMPMLPPRLGYFQTQGFIYISRIIEDSAPIDNFTSAVFRDENLLRGNIRGTWNHFFEEYGFEAFFIMRFPKDVIVANGIP